MYAGLTLVTPPLAEPISVADAKAHSRIFTNVDDSLIPGYISSARMAAENTLKRGLLTQQWTLALQNWPGRPLGVYREANTREEYYRWAYIQLPLPPLVSVDNFNYMDTQGNVYYMTQGYGNAVGNYLLDLDHEPGRVTLPFAGIWPTTILLPTSPIHITYTCGWPFSSGTNIAVTTGGLATLTLASPPGSTFSPQMTGTWITINGVSYNVLSYISPSQVQLAVGPSGVISNGTWTANTVPMPIRHAILFLAGHAYETREPVITGRGEVAIEIPGTVDALLEPYRCHEYINDGDNQ